jgi:hypothetical protein
MASKEYEWQKTRRRADAPPGLTPIKGYGANGEYTLYVQHPEVCKERKFVDGKPTVSSIASVSNDPEITEKRERVLQSFSVENQNNTRYIVHAGIALMEYSACLLKRVYELSDDDLTMLHSGDSWIKPMMIHAIGGERFAQKLASDAIQASFVEVAAPTDFDLPVSGPSEATAPIFYDNGFDLASD